MTFTIEQIAFSLVLHRTSVVKRAAKENWTFDKNGKTHHYHLSGLPCDVQIALARAYDLSPDCPDLSPSAAMALLSEPSGGASAPLPSPAGCAAGILTLSSAVVPSIHTNGRNGRASAPVSGLLSSWGGDGPKCDASIINDKRVMKIARVLAECEAVPPGVTKSEWINSVAIRNGTTRATIYKWKKKQAAGGLANLKHYKPFQGQAVAWDDQALDFWIGLVLKRSHRKKSMKDLYYNALIVEANRRGWKIGSYDSACEWAAKRITPALLRLQKGGLRALDNAIPPVMRSYADLDPFRFIVGDQHQFDIWVTDAVTGEVFRPEGYFWQDLRTRLWYGAAIDRKYDSHLMGLSLHIGCRSFGIFDTLYTDNGKPEQSKYITQVVRDIRALGAECERTRDDIPSDLVGMEDDEDMPIYRMGQKFAIVKNAKAKMIEGSFRFLEQILINQFGVPGHVKRLGGNIDENDVDEAEIQRLAKAGKLLTFDEFRITLYRALDWYNRVRPHRGIRREWCFGPKPKDVRPADVLMACYREGWRPKKVSPEALSLIFLPEKRPNPTVQKGRIEAFGDFWEAPNVESSIRLLEYEKQKVVVKYDPMALTELLVFGPKGEFITLVRPIERGSMIDQDKTSRLIAQKRRLRKTIEEQYRQLTSDIPDYRQYSQVPAAEKAAAQVGQEKKRVAREQAETMRVPSDDEMAAGVARIEHYRPERVRPAFRGEPQRYVWILEQISDGYDLADDDVAFMAGFEAGMDEKTREYYDIFKGSLNIKINQA